MYGSDGVGRSESTEEKLRQKKKKDKGIEKSRLEGGAELGCNVD